MPNGNETIMIKPTIILPTIALAVCASGAWSQPQQQPETKGPYHHRWDEFLEQISVGDELSEAKSKLGEQTDLVGYMPAGGTGRVHWVFRIDDVSEIIVSVDKDDIVESRPLLVRRRQWIRFPDGSIAPASVLED